MQKARTVEIGPHDGMANDIDDLDFMVTSYTLKDDTMLTKLGKHAFQAVWKVDVQGQPHEFEIEVDKGVLTSTKFVVKYQNKQVFPPAANSSKVMKQDFLYPVRFAGRISGLNEVDYFELRPSTGARKDLWYQAILTRQSPDGRAFDAKVLMESNGNDELKWIDFYLVEAKDIRIKSTQETLVVPERTLFLKVPETDPIHETMLYLDEEKNGVTHLFGRKTPHVVSGHEVKEVLFQVDRNRSRVTANVGSYFLREDTKSRVFSVPELVDLQKKHVKWCIQVGPLATSRHTIEITRPDSLSSKAFTVTVDGEILVHGKKEDIDCKDNFFALSFKLKGIRTYKFKVYQTNKDGTTLDTQGIAMSKPQKYVHEISLKVVDEKNLQTAVCEVNGDDIKTLPNYPDMGQEIGVDMSVQELYANYALEVPYLIDESALTGFDAFYSNVQQAGVVGTGFFSGLLACCSPKLDTDTEAMYPP